MTDRAAKKRSLEEAARYSFTGGIMVTDSPPGDYFGGDMLRVWRKVTRAFSYENATISDSDLLSQHSHLGLPKEEIRHIIDWSKEQHFIEPADEGGRLRLTPQGRRVWREARDQT